MTALDELLRKADMVCGTPGCTCLMGKFRDIVKRQEQELLNIACRKNCECASHGWARTCRADVEKIAKGET